MYAQLGSREGSCQWSSGCSSSAAGPMYTVDDHEARCDAVAGPDGGVFGVGFVNVGEYFGELGSVVGDFQDVVLCLAYEVG